MEYQKIKKRYLIITIVAIATLVLSACGGGAAPTPTEAAKQPTSRPTEKTAEKPTVQLASKPEVATPEVLNLANISAGLGDLNSYKASFTMTFDGKQNGRPMTSTMSSAAEFVKNPPAKRITIAVPGSRNGTPLPDIGIAESIEVDGKQYSKMGDICTQVTAESGPQANAMPDPNSIIGGVRSAQRVGNETVNGMPTVHYKLDITNLEMLGYHNGNGDAWMADPGDYVVKYTLQATSNGKENFFGGIMDEGTIMLVYEVTDVNQPIDIQAPADCGGAADDILVMADAQDKAAMGSMITYSSPSAYKDVVAFYEKEMKAKGWMETEGSGMSAQGMSMKFYTKDGRTVQISIRSDGSSGKTSVMIVEEKK